MSARQVSSSPPDAIRALAGADELLAAAAADRYVRCSVDRRGGRTSPGDRGDRATGGWLTRQLLCTHSVVALGMYSDNDGARRIHLRLGYGRDHEFTSGRIVRG